MEQITIREYTAADETAWVRCRVISFLDCSYWNDVKREKERYPLGRGVEFFIHSGALLILFCMV